MRGAVACLVAAAVCWTTSSPALAYLKLGSRAGTRTVTLKWSRMPVRYFVTNRDVPGVTATQLQTSAARAFANWAAAPHAQLSSEFAGFTQSNPSLGDGAVVLGFVNRSDLDRTLGATSFLFDTTNGDLIESDIFFNSAFPWSVAASGEPGRFDLESIALHEIGHLHGLGHSALGETELIGGGRRVISAEAVMFPIAFSLGNIAGRSLKSDDMAGIAEIYPTSAFSRETGSISGKVTKSGTGVQGAHVTAFNLRTGRLVGGFSLTEDGSFVIAGLEPGPQVVRAEPLDDGDLTSFFDASLNVDANFRVKFYEKLVVVPRAGGATNVEIKVVPK